MPSPASSSPLTATLLAALWLASGRCGASETLGPGCDDGKLYLDIDLPSDAVHWGCSAPSLLASAQRLPSIDTVYDPEPARHVCMDHPIFYNHSIPNSGPFRPVMAESGEYLYCPPQRWLNNLHHGATVLLYHPCAVPRERRLLSGLARSCLPGHVVTSHPQLSRDMPIALVSWGRTLELTTAASFDVCDWLQATQSTGNGVGGKNRTKKYDFLLIRSAGLQRLGPSAKTKDAVKQCCEQTISSLLRGTRGVVPSVKQVYLKQTKEGRKKRDIRAAVGQKMHIDRKADKALNDSRLHRTANSRNHSSSLGPAPSPRPERRRDFSSTPTAALVSHKSIVSSQHEGADSVRDGTKQGNTGKVVDVEEREAERSDMPLPTKLDSASKSQSGIQRKSSSEDRSDCANPAAAENRGAVVNVGPQRTPRTDEAAWAAAALGFLLVLLTLSILHTRLYRHWRTTPSLYWHDPQQDYDSVADVIRRRLRIAKRRRKRSRRKECVLLPSSSSSDESP